MSKLQTAIRHRTLRVMRTTLLVLSIVFIVVGIVNFVTFCNESERLGGDALNGYSEGGRFFVSSHGHATAVTEATWKRSRFQATSVFITHPLAMISMAYLLFQYIFPAMVYRGSRGGMDQEVRLLSESMLITAITCGGKIGSLNFSGAFLKVQMHEKGLVLKPSFMPAFGIRYSQMSTIQLRDGLLEQGVEITHTSSQVATPLLLRSVGAAFLSELQARTTHISGVEQGPAEDGPVL